MPFRKVSVVRGGGAKRRDTIHFIEFVLLRPVQPFGLVCRWKTGSRCVKPMCKQVKRQLYSGDSRFTRWSLECTAGILDIRSGVVGVQLKSFPVQKTFDSWQVQAKRTLCRST